MKKYNTLLFDLDDTILDFKKGEKIALTALLEEMQAGNVNEVIEDYIVINKGLWRELEKGNVDREYVLNNRFSMLFKKYNRDLDGIEVENRFRYYLNMQHEFVEGAEELLEKLGGLYKIYIVTNGVSHTQYKRIKDANLEGFFTEIFVSEDIGYQKPSKKYFEEVARKIEGFEPERTLIVGDSLTADIAGGMEFGIDPCWLNQNSAPNTTNISPTYEIKKLSDLYDILNL